MGQGEGTEGFVARKENVARSEILRRILRILTGLAGPVKFLKERPLQPPSLEHNGVMPVTNHLLRFTQPWAITFLNTNIPDLRIWK